MVRLSQFVAPTVLAAVLATKETFAAQFGKDLTFQGPKDVGNGRQQIDIMTTGDLGGLGPTALAYTTSWKDGADIEGKINVGYNATGQPAGQGVRGSYMLQGERGAEYTFTLDFHGKTSTYKVRIEADGKLTGALDFSSAATCKPTSGKTGTHVDCTA